LGYEMRCYGLAFLRNRNALSYCFGNLIVGVLKLHMVNLNANK